MRASYAGGAGGSAKIRQWPAVRLQSYEVSHPRLLHFQTTCALTSRLWRHVCLIRLRKTSNTLAIYQLQFRATLVCRDHGSGTIAMQDK